MRVRSNQITFKQLIQFRYLHRLVYLFYYIENVVNAIFYTTFIDFLLYFY